MPGSPLTIQAWFQATAQYGCLPGRERGGKAALAAAAAAVVVVVQGARLGVGGVRECVTRDCVSVCVRLLLEVPPSRAAVVLSVERQDDISSLE